MESCKMFHLGKQGKSKVRLIFDFMFMAVKMKIYEYEFLI